MDFLVDLEVFRGPLDLLLYLVRKHEVEITEIPIAPITDQFLAYLAVIEQLDVDAVGDFLDMASTLVEIKSRMVLPRSEEIEEPLDDPRRELVERLLEYKRFKDAAMILEERSRDWQERYPRLASDLVERGRSPADEPIRELELWDLVSAFGRILREREAAKPSSIVYDDTPIHVYMARIHAQLLERGQLAFSELFRHYRHKSAAVGIFLAILELVRHHHARVEQNELYSEIWVLPGAEPMRPLNLAVVDEYDGRVNAQQN
ncbi:MAG TPA: segregation/condensation protein A [Pirellulales bacterium]